MYFLVAIKNVLTRFLLQFSFEIQSKTVKVQKKTANLKETLSNMYPVILQKNYYIALYSLYLLYFFTVQPFAFRLWSCWCSVHRPTENHLTYSIVNTLMVCES